MSFIAPTRQRSGPLLPMAAMVDILFLLLVFFMTISSMREQDRVIEVVLPGTQTDQPGAMVTPIIITVDAEGRTHIADQLYPLDVLGERLQQRAAEYPDEPVDIRGDANCTHGRIISVLDTVRAAGLRNVRIHTRPIERRGEEP
jgi:biopolymer transport protein ExbD